MPDDTSSPKAARPSRARAKPTEGTPGTAGTAGTPGNAGHGGAAGTGGAGGKGEPGRRGAVGLTGPAVDVTELVSAMHEVAAANVHLGEDFRASRPQVRQLSRIAKLLVVAMTVIVALGGINLYNTARIVQSGNQRAQILKILEDGNNPNSTQSQQALKRLVTFVDTDIVVCIENHSDRAAAHIQHLPVPPLAPGCPA